MSTGTVTRSATQTSSYTKIVYVTRKVQADLLAILDTYDYFSEDHAVALIADLRTFLDEDVIGAVKFVWKEPGTYYVMEELRYTVIVGGVRLADDRPGGIGCNPALADADFTVHVTYNDRWWKMSAEDRQAVHEVLLLNWGPAGTLSYSNGTWRAGRMYSSSGYGLSRRSFSRW
jgi:hypothetical protein